MKMLNELLVYTLVNSRQYHMFIYSVDSLLTANLIFWHFANDSSSVLNHDP